MDLQFIESKSKSEFKNLVKRKAREYAFMNFLEKKEGHSKMNNLFYSALDMQDYLKAGHLTTEEAQAVYSYRTRMSEYRDNFKGQGGPIICPLCQIHLDVQNL